MRNGPTEYDAGRHEQERPGKGRKVEKEIEEGGMPDVYECDGRLSLRRPNSLEVHELAA